MHGRGVVIWVALLAGSIPLQSAELTPAAKQAFDHYVDLFEQNWKRDLRARNFLYIDTDSGAKARVRDGQTLILSRKPEAGKEVKASGGTIQDWLGAVFIRNASLDQVRAAMQDYKNYKRFFGPEVIESRQLQHSGDNFRIFLRLYKRQVLPVVFNANYDVHYAALGAGRLAVVSRSTRIAEVKDPGQPDGDEEPVGNDDGFLWALNSYWRFEEADGGVYAECEAISLSRDVPLGLAWMIGKFLEHFPKDSMENTLAGVKKAALAQAATGDVDRSSLPQ